MRRSAYWGKRLLDIAGATVGLALLVPLLPWVALAIRLDSRGPIFFRQRRVGIDRRAGIDRRGSGGDGPERRRQFDAGGAVFWMVKFRTMRADAEKIAGPSWTADNDPRITRVGAILRKTKIDELPQLWNVLCGEMSLVGPRPETPHFVEQLTDQLPVYRERVSGVKPGITGLAQIQCEDDGSFFGSLREKIYYDMLYGAKLLRMQHWYQPLLLDVGIILKTLRRLLDLRKTIDNDVIRIELPRRFEYLDFDPKVLAHNPPPGVREEILDNNPDKITVWWYLPRTRPQRPPEHDFMGMQVLRYLSDRITYTRDKDGKGVNELRIVKLLREPEGEFDAALWARRHPPEGDRTPGIERRDVIKVEAPSKVQHIPRVVGFVAPVWERLSAQSSDPSFSFNMSLVLFEGLTNVVKHAHQQCPEKRIPLEIAVFRDQVRLSILDYGTGFDLDTDDAAGAEPDADLADQVRHAVAARCDRHAPASEAAPGATQTAAATSTSAPASEAAPGATQTPAAPTTSAPATSAPTTAPRG